MKLKPVDDHYLDSFIPSDFYQMIKNGKAIRDFYPPFSDEESWKKAAESPYAKRIIENAEESLKTPVPVLSYDNYCRFRRDGNRAEYEKPYFQRREHLAYLALAICLTRNKEKYMLQLFNYAVAVLEEWTWCVPAHMVWMKDGIHPRHIRPTDLFSSETGCVMAALVQILGDELDQEWEGFSEWIRKETLERTVYNAIWHRDPEDPFTTYWVETPVPQNWTIWCSVNNLYAASVCETDPEKLEFFTKEFVRLASRFTSLCFDDGYCPEGPSYYTKAGLMLFRMLDLLNKMVPGSMEKLYAEPKIRNIFEFVAKVRIGNDQLISFADGSPLMLTNFSVLMPAAKAINSIPLLRFGAGKQSDLGATVNGDYLVSSLALLFDYPEQMPDETEEDEPFTLFPDRLAVFRSSGFSAVLKAGNNREPHNHLDLGHFSVYSDGEPVIVDAGTEAYTQKHFSPERYSIWYLGAAGHNAPVFGEYGQEEDWDYTASLNVIQPGLIQCDLSNAYPEKAGVKHFLRTLDFNSDRVIISDDFELKESLPVNITLFSVPKPEILSGNRVRLGNVIMILDGLSVKETAEMPELKLRFGELLWGGSLTAIRLTGTGSGYRLMFQKSKD